VSCNFYSAPSRGMVLLLAGISLLPCACCKHDSAADSPAPSGSAARPNATAPATPAASTKAAPNDRAARKAEYCKHHDAMKGLLTPKCQQCLQGSPKAKAMCEAHAAAKNACEKKVPDARTKEGLSCMVECGVQCNCTLACYEKSMPECIDAYLTTIACVESACEDSCK
jgi:hypothetical protein